MPENKESPVKAVYDEVLCKFRQRYQRNNKRGGLKNLRCFPTCAEQHKERGFCGRSVVVYVTYPKSKRNMFASYLNREQGKACGAGYICRAEFVKEDEDGLIKLGETIEYSKIASLGRSKKEPTKPWVEGEYIQAKSTDAKAVFEFNKDRKGWHYGWASNKHTCNAKHCLQTYVFEPISSDTLKCMYITRSNPFMLFCRRRRRFVCVPSAPISPPKKRKLPGSTSLDKKKLKVEHSLPQRKKEDKVNLEPDGGSLDALDYERVKHTKALSIARLEAILSGISKAIANMPYKYNSAGEEALDLQMPRSEMNMIDDNGIWDLDAEVFDSLDQGNESHETGSILSSSDLLDFSNSIADCLDYFATNYDTQIENKLEPSEIDLFSDVSDGRKVSEFKKAAVIEDLCQYLLHETSFTEAIQKLNKVQDEINEEGAKYQHFLHVLEKNLNGFMRKHNLTKEQFDDIFGISHELVLDSQLAKTVVEEVKPQGLFKNIYDSFVTLVSNPKPALEDKTLRPKSIVVNENSIPNHSGRWIRTDEASKKMEEMRAIIGIPWLLGKMFDYMEAAFEIEQKGMVMIFRLRRKLLSNGTVKMILDGKERSFGLKLPIMTSLSRNWTHRAFANENTITTMHTFGKHRLTRVSWLSKDNNTLHSNVILEIYDDEKNSFVEKTRVQQDSFRDE